MNASLIEKEFPKIRKLKDGTEIKIRLMDRNDRDRILEFFKNIPEEEKIYLRENVSDPKEIENYWIRRIEDKYSITLLAFLMNEMVGEATLHQDMAGWSSHVGHIRINVAKKFQSRGIATILADEIYNIATKVGLEKVCAEIIREQEKALKIFKHLGFKEEAILKDHVKDLKGQKHDLILLSNNPSELLDEIKRHIEFMDMGLLSGVSA